MKKTILLLASVCIALLANAQVLKTIDIPAAGTLYKYLSKTERTTVTNLTLTGTIDARDFVTLHYSFPALSVLDISGVTIASYYGSIPPSDALRIYGENEIPECAFFDASKGYNTVLTKVILSDKIKALEFCAFANCTALKSINLPKTITVFEGGCLAGCSSLTSITIPELTTKIGDDAFGCVGLTSIYVRSKTPIDLTLSSSIGGFSSINKITCILYVPIGSKSLYQSAEQWKDFQNIIEFDTNKVYSTVNTSNICIYPNLVTEKITIKTDQEATFLIYSMDGTFVLKDFVIDEKTIGVNSLPIGLYYIMIKTGKEQILKTFIKQ